MFNTMNEEEFKLIRRSFICRIVFTIAGAFLLVAASYFKVIFFGLAITGIISLLFFFIVSVKIFPDSTDFFSEGYKNHSRKSKGLDLIARNYKISGDKFDDYRRG